LTGDVDRPLFVVPIGVDSLIATHRLDVRFIHTQRPQHPLALNQQNVAHVTCVFEHRPGLHVRPLRGNRDVALHNHGGDL